MQFVSIRGKVDKHAVGIARTLRMDRATGSSAVLLIALTVGAGLLRFYHLGYKSLWLDEAVVYWIAQGDLATILRANADRNSAPPLFALLVNLVARISDSEFSLRFISAAAATAAVPTLYMLARRWTSFYGACFCAMLAACAPRLVLYAQGVREYGLTLLLATLVLLLFSHLWTRLSWRTFSAWTVVAAIGICTQYGLALLTFTLSLMLLLRICTEAEVRVYMRRWVAAHMILAAVVGVVYLVSLRHQFEPGGFGAGGTSTYLARAYWNGTLESLVDLTIRGTYVFLQSAYPRPLLLVPLLVAGIYMAARARGTKLALVLFALPLLCTFAAALLRLYPYHGGPQNTFLMPMTYVMLGLGFDGLRSVHARRCTILAVVALFLVNGLWSTLPYLQAQGEEEMRPIAETLASAALPGDPVYVYYGAAPAFHYYYRNDHTLLIDGVASRGRPERYFQQLDPLLAHPGHFWLVFSHCYRDECAQITRYVGERRTLKQVLVAPGVSLYLAQ